MLEPVLVLGGGEHARVLIDAIERQQRYRIDTILDPAGRASELCGYPVSTMKPSEAVIRAGIIAIGDNWTRSRVAAAVAEECPGFRFITVVHPSAVTGRGVRIGDGSVVMAGVTINPDSVIGRHCIVNTSASIDHDCTLDDFASVAPGVTLGGRVSVGAYAAVSLGAVCVHGRSIGEHAVVGAGAVVVRDVPARVVAFGNPCRVVRERRPGDQYL